MADKVEETPATSFDITGENSLQVKVTQNLDAVDGDPSVIRKENPEPEDGEAKKLAEGKEEEGEDVETYREAKRRKNCPAALEKSPSDRGFSFSFTFDTSIFQNDSTPKFGSFNFNNAAESGLPASDSEETPLGLRLGFFEEEEEIEKEKIVADSASIVREEREKSTC